jgi:hypothetical protein
MLTPNDVKIKRQEVMEGLKDSMLLPQYAEEEFRLKLLSLYVEVLREIATGSIDPKSLAMATLDIEA